jgi:hypothetical protein
VERNNSQGHKFWCGLTCGEEDIDWEVSKSDLTLVAKRAITAGARVMVVGYLGTEDRREKSLLVRRSNLLDHACFNNTTICEDKIDCLLDKVCYQYSRAGGNFK